MYREEHIHLYDIIKSDRSPNILQVCLFEAVQIKTTKLK